MVHHVALLVYAFNVHACRFTDHDTENAEIERELNTNTPKTLFSRSKAVVRPHFGKQVERPLFSKLLQSPLCDTRALIPR